MEPLWRPDDARRGETLLGTWIDEHGSYEALHRWSVTEPGAFWSSVWDRLGVVGARGSVPFRITQKGSDLRDGKFFPEARLSYAENALHGHGAGGDVEAVVAINEDGVRRALTWDELRAEVAATAAALRSEGVGGGDRVAIWLPAGIEALVLLLATNAIGAISASVSPDFGAAGALDRFGQLEPKLLVTSASYRYGGRDFFIGDRVDEVQRSVASLRRTVFLHEWSEWLAPHRDKSLVFERLPFEHPLYVLFSSGTTGKPKGITHGAGGVLLKHLTEHALHMDVRVGDRITWFTTTGWMMWNWLVSGLTVGATVVLYDGNPSYPTIGRLFSVADDEALSLLGVSAKFIDAVSKADYHPNKHHALDTVRTIGSTGSPLSPDGFRFVYDSMKSDVHLASISGGTDLCGCFVAGDPTAPVYVGEMQRAVLGMDVHAWDEEGHDTPIGTAGELICATPFPSMPVYFWNDDHTSDPYGARYTAAYFGHFTGKWRHGDFVTVTERGGYVIHGRSDATLNPGGIRIGTAEITQVVEQLPQIVESLAFGQEWEGDTRVILLVRMRDDTPLTEELRTEIRARVRAACTPRHVPAKVVAVSDLPRTRSNKLVELAVSDAVNGRPVRNTDGLANPEALWAIAELAELRA